jgi:UDP-N-acetyl-D-mannosaminuronic acid dehydrogenase
MNFDEVVIIGLGYVGLTLAVHMANRGFKIHGVDKSDEVISDLDKGRAHFFEKDFDPIVKTIIQQGTLTYQKTIPPSNCKRIFIITVGTPVDDNGQVSLNSIREVTASITGALNEGDMVILRSTVEVGITREIVKTELDRTGKNYLLAFCPERTIEGKALEELATLPQIVGGIDKDSTDAAARMFKQLTKEVIIVDEVEEAETAKLVNNAERDVSFAFANEVAMLCESRGINVENVIHAVNYRYPRSDVKLPGLVGGPCLAKDTYILAEGFKEYGVTPAIAIASRKLNESLAVIPIKRIINKLQDAGTPINRIGIVGLAFKGQPPTSDLRGSLVIDIIRTLSTTLPGTPVYGYDSLVKSADRQESTLSTPQAVFY